MLSPLFKQFFVVAGIIGGVALVASGFYVALDLIAVDSSRAMASVALSEGKYDEALAGFSEALARAPDDDAARELFEKAKSLLIAEEDYNRAVLAAADGDFFLVYALLSGSTASHNQEFKYYDETIALLNEAASDIEDVENADASHIAQLKREAAMEGAARREAEALKAREAIELTEQLTKAAVEKQQTESQLQNAKSELEQKAAQVSAQQKQIAEEQARAHALAEAAEREREEKFVQDLQNYVDMILSGEDKVRIAAAELSAGNADIAFFRIGNAQAVFDEARDVGDLRSRPIPNNYQSAADAALRAIIAFEDAVSEFKKAIIINDDSDNLYVSSLNAYQEKFDKGIVLRKEAENFISNH